MPRRRTVNPSAQIEPHQDFLDKCFDPKCDQRIPSDKTDAFTLTCFPVWSNGTTYHGVLQTQTFLMVLHQISDSSNDDGSVSGFVDKLIDNVFELYRQLLPDNSAVDVPSEREKFKAYFLSNKNPFYECFKPITDPEKLQVLTGEVEFIFTMMRSPFEDRNNFHEFYLGEMDKYFDDSRQVETIKHLAKFKQARQVKFFSASAIFMLAFVIGIALKNVKEQKEPINSYGYLMVMAAFLLFFYSMFIHMKQTFPEDESRLEFSTRLEKINSIMSSKVLKTEAASESKVLADSSQSEEREDSSGTEEDVRTRLRQAALIHARKRRANPQNEKISLFSRLKGSLKTWWDSLSQPRLGLTEEDIKADSKANQTIATKRSKAKGVRAPQKNTETSSNSDHDSDREFGVTQSEFELGDQLSEFSNFTEDENELYGWTPVPKQRQRGLLKKKNDTGSVASSASTQVGNNHVPQKAQVLQQKVAPSTAEPMPEVTERAYSVARNWAALAAREPENLFSKLPSVIVELMQKSSKFTASPFDFALVGGALPASTFPAQKFSINDWDFKTSLTQKQVGELFISLTQRIPGCLLSNYKCINFNDVYLCRGTVTYEGQEYRLDVNCQQPLYKNEQEYAQASDFNAASAFAVYREGRIDVLDPLNGLKSIRDNLPLETNAPDVVSCRDQLLKDPKRILRAFYLRYKFNMPSFGKILHQTLSTYSSDFVHAIHQMPNFLKQPLLLKIDSAECRQWLVDYKMMGVFPESLVSPTALPPSTHAPSYRS